MPAKPKGLPYMPFYFGDFFRSTMGWPLNAICAYFFLLAAQWEHVVLPCSLSDLAVICRLSRTEFQTLWNKYLKAKFPPVKGGRQNARLELHREESIKRSKHGTDAANARHEKERRTKEEEAKKKAESVVTELAQHKRLDHAAK